ncbi:hypothetical protein [Ectopseudomonas oleovorans]|uniref:hypothetical protein n=1 Tax=Ectopseudomonas oleovorans TaxID=301 RepID=UPI00241C3F90|nr:hypothetical protein [Pseudomonas oleovorans]
MRLGQYNQPVTKGYGPDLLQPPSIAATNPASGGGGGGISGVVQQAKNVYSVVSPLINPLGTAVDVLTAAPADYLRNSVIRRAGGDPATSDGGEYANRDRAFGNLQPVINAASGAMDAVEQGVKGGVLAATGASPAPQTAAKPSAVAAAVPGKPSAANQDQVAPQPTTESPYFATGTDQIVARMNGSVPEFTNDPTAVAGARALPAGGRGSPLLAPGVSNMADDVPLERRGSINNIGNGIGGGLSVGQAGDAAMALGRFERANQEREKMVQISRRGGIGEGGGRLTVVGDNSWLASRRAPTLAERQRARLDAMGAEAEAARSQAQQGVLSGMDERLTNQLNRQRTQQELNIGGIQLAERQRLEGLAAQMADTSLSQDQREAARSAYTSLSTPAKDRYQSQDIIIGRDEDGRDIRGSQLIDVTTGRPVTGGIGDFSPPRRTVTSAEVDATAKSRGISKDQVIQMLQGIGVTVSG